MIAATYSNLQILEFNGISIYLTIKVIQNTIGNLWKINVTTPVIDELNYLIKESREYVEYIQAIYKYCPYVRYVSLFLNNQSFDELKNLLVNCQHLEGIFVARIDQHKDKKFDDSEFFDLLAKFSPISLYKAHINKLLKFDSFKDLFNNWKDRKPLQVYSGKSCSGSLGIYYLRCEVYGHDRHFWGELCWFSNFNADYIVDC